MQRLERSILRIYMNLYEFILCARFLRSVSFALQSSRIVPFCRFYALALALAHRIALTLVVVILRVVALAVTFRSLCSGHMPP